MGLQLPRRSAPVRSADAPVPASLVSLKSHRHIRHDAPAADGGADDPGSPSDVGGYHLTGPSPPNYAMPHLAPFLSRGKVATSFAVLGLYYTRSFEKCERQGAD